MIKKPKIVFLDFETAPIVATTWTLYPKALSHSNILKDWYIICGAYKEVGKPVKAIAITKPGSDKQLCKEFRAAIADADILVGHNLDKFDIKKFNARLIQHKLPPLPLIPTVDTLKEVRKIASFTSHRLDYLGKLLVGSGKIHTEYNLWLDVMAGDKIALNKMVKYCKGDVVLLEQVYNALLPYMKTHPHVGAIGGAHIAESCNKCGSTHLKRNGIRVTASGLQKQELQCMNCGGYQRVALGALINN